MQDFIYNIPTKVYFGRGHGENLCKELKKAGRNVLLVYGGGSIKKMGLYDRITEISRAAEINLYELPGIDPNPRIDSVRKGAEICKKYHVDAVLAAGGGSVMDAAKFIAAGALTEADPWTFFSKETKIKKALPLIMIPTSAASGSEMNNAGVISNPKTRDKLSCKAEAIIPSVTFENPENTYTCSAYQTACGSADILSHIMEVYFHRDRDFAMIDGMQESMMRSVVKYAEIALMEPENYEARANLLWTSSWAINSFTRVATPHPWSCHSLEHQLSAYYDITHGLGLAILTPRWMEYCLNEETVPRMRQFAVNVFGVNSNLNAREAARQGIKHLSHFLYDTLGLDRTLGSIGIDDRNFSEMAKKAVKGSVIRGFQPLRAEDAEKIYRMCL